MTDIYQKKLHDIVSDLMHVSGLSEETEKYFSVISMVYTLIEEDKANELDLALRRSFPEYYNSPFPVDISPKLGSIQKTVLILIGLIFTVHCID
jgi:hypothetical protein